MSELRFVVMAKRPDPGRVKTRLIRPDGLTPEAAAAVATAMAACIVARLASRGRVTIAISPDGPAPGLAEAVGDLDVAWVGQGDGDLGDRIERIWRSAGVTGPLAFFGIDSPDVPGSLLDRIPVALGASDAVVGPTHDGGYWTIGANRPASALLTQIDWGTGSVYHQTTLRAASAGIRLTSLPRWHDVDEPVDLEALRSRLTASADGIPDASPSSSADDRQMLGRLARRLDEVCEGEIPSATADDD